MADLTMPAGYGTRARPNGGIQFRHQDPRVAAHIARVVLKNNMNFEAAVAAMSPRKLTDEQIAAQAFVLKRAPKVQAEIQKLYQTIGLDDEAFKKYWSVLWEWMLSGDRPRAVTGAKLLGAIFGINDKADESKKPQVLKIAGLEEGLKAMGVTPSANPTGFGKIEDEDEENG
jgi:hypothetical protein